MRWWLGPGVEPERARPLLESARRAVDEGAADEKSGRRKALYRLALEAGEPEFLLKVSRASRGAGLFSRLRPSKARRELDVAAALAERGIATPVPFAAGEERRAGILDAGYLLVPALAGASDLREAFVAGAASAQERRAWTVALGRLVRRLHDEGLQQDDLAPNNFLVRGSSVLPVDFERARLRGPVGEAARRFALAKLERNAPGASAATRMRFLLAYCGGDRGRARGWWRALESESAALAVRDLARLRRGSTREGRRVRRVSCAGWRGIARAESAHQRQVETDLAGPGPRGIAPRGPLWLRGSTGTSRAAARTLWATAHLLWRRGLGAQPVALLRHRGETRLYLERDTTSRACRPEDAQRLTVHLDRLLALGSVADLRAESLAVVPAVGAILLDPGALRVASAGSPEGRRAQARRLAAQVLRDLE